MQVTLLLGDVSFLHDTNGLALLSERYLSIAIVAHIQRFLI